MDETQDAGSNVFEIDESPGNMDPLKTTAVTTQINTRQRILEASARLFAEHGYADTSVRDIASALGISNPSLYHHFKAKSHILMELLVEPMACVERSVAASMSLQGRERTRCIINGLLDSVEIHSGIVGRITAGATDQMPAELRAVASTANAMVLDLLKQSIATDHADLRVAMAVAAITGVVTDLVVRTSGGDQFVTQLQNMREPMMQLVLKVLHDPL